MVSEELYNAALDFVNKVKNESQKDIVIAVDKAIVYYEENEFKSIADEP